MFSLSLHVFQPVTVWVIATVYVQAGAYPIHLAAEGGDVKVIHRLLAAGGLPNLKDRVTLITHYRTRTLIL